jgi:hypothetical protein
MSDDAAANLLAFLRNGFQAPPQNTGVQQLLSLIQAQQQNQALFNNIQYLPQLQLLQAQSTLPSVLTSPHIESKPNKLVSPSLTALKLNLDHQNNQAPLSSTTSIDEGVMTSSNSPTETVSGTVSPVHEDHELPKEPEHASLKRPAAIQDMLMKKKKKARLDGLMDGLLNKKVNNIYSFYNSI